MSVMFSSGKHAKLTADPTPYYGHLNSGAGWGIPHRTAEPHAGLRVWLPRPEFDRPLTNPANPILSELRRHPGTLGIGALHAFDEANVTAWVKAGEPYDGPFSEWWQFETHAMRVIERLATE